MRVHRLAITAFGPFAGTEEVDLDALGANGLFLLHGATGAGKTSVLDAVCFALYGAVPGSRHGARLRSDHAEPGAAPEVVCEFTAAGRRLEVTRSPSWERPKRRGTGVTTEQARVLVREFRGGEWTPLTNRVDEASLVLDGAVGLGLEQFTKLVLLPQGEFAAFLRADAETRRVLLERLFGTDRFTAVQQWLRESQAALRGRVEAAQARTEQLVARAEQAALPAGVLPPPEGGDAEAGGAGPGTRPDDRVKELQASVAAAFEEARRQRVATQERARHAAAELDAARRAAQLQARHRQLAERAERLRAQAAAQEARRARLSAARRAAGLSRWLGPLDAARSRSDAALAAVDAAMVELDACGPLEPAAPVRAPAAATLFDLPVDGALLGDAGLDDAGSDDAGLDDAGLDDAGLEAQAAAALQLVGELAALEQEAAEAAELGPAVELAREQLSSRQQELDEAAAAGVLHRNAVRAAAVELEAARATAAGEDAAGHVVRQARERARAAEQAERLAGETVLLEGRREQLRRRRDDAREVWLDLRERRLRGMAAELAAGMLPGDPCPVCGGIEHPAPAGSDGDAGGAAAVDAGAEERAGVATEAAQEELRACESELARVGALAEAAGSAAAGLPVPAARQELAAAESALAAARLAAGRADAAAQAYAGCERAARAAESRHEQVAAARQTAATALARLEERLLALTRRLDAGRGGHAGVTERRAHAARRARGATALLEARRELHRATEHLAEVTRSARAASADAAFGDLETACAAALPEAELVALDNAGRAYDQEAGAVEAGLSEPGMAAAAQAPPAEPAALATAWELAQGDDEAAAAAHDRCDTAAAALAVIAADLTAHLTATEPAVQRYRLESDLSRCLDGTGGDNALRMSLSSYVLAARLEQVAAAASERLLVMSSGRYSLVHCDDVQRGQRRSGLALRVVDGWTGRERDTASLSGGEAFYTSLSLALGLADVVTAEAGGAGVETLFVDEGFGSLDEDTLGEVMDVLDGLRSGGRVVGLVSHVADLRDRIPSRLEVVKTRSGSTVRLATA